MCELWRSTPIDSTPPARLWQAIMKILAYPNETKSFEITYMRGSGLELEVYADADYADKAKNRRWMSGIAVTVGGAVEGHASKTQHVVLSSALDAEYIAAGDGVREPFFSYCSVFHCSRDEWGKH